MDPLFRVDVLAKTQCPQLLTYSAMHQDYAEGYIYDEYRPDQNDVWLYGKLTEEEAGEQCVKHLLKGGRGHFGPCEAPQITFSVGYFPHSVMQQARTHRVGVSFDVQCLAADTLITFVDVNGHTSPKKKKAIGDLYDLWMNGETAIRDRRIKGRSGQSPGQYRRDCKKRIRKMRVRSLDESSNTFTTNYIEDIVCNGLNPIYKVTLADGKVLKCTENHKIYTPHGWCILGDLSVGSDVMVNGRALADAETTYQDKDWLMSHFSKGLKPRDVAAIAGCSTEAVKKWAYFHKLVWQKTQWNKGLNYSITISDEDRRLRGQRISKLTQDRKTAGLIPSGPDHPSWKNLPPEKRAYNWLKYQRYRIIQEKGGSCEECGTTANIHVHHTIPVIERPDLAFDETNMELLCGKCHARHHKLRSKNPLCSHPVKIISIDYVGVEQTYDLVMSDPHHNFVANGIVVHNSFRYSGQRIARLGESFSMSPIHLSDKAIADIESIFYLRPVGDYTDRTGKRYTYDDATRYRDLIYCADNARLYANKIGNGFSEEHARSQVCFDVRQHFVVSFNARSLMHFLDLRSKADAQLEIQQMCDLMFPHFKMWMPEIATWYETNRLHKARLAP